jgi:hypothetical protein
MLRIASFNLYSCVCWNYRPVLLWFQIESGAFSYCFSLSFISIPKGVRRLEERFFLGCFGLRVFVFEPGSELEIIEGYTFSECTSLTSICLPASVTLFSDFSFSNLDFIYYVESERNWSPGIFSLSMSQINFASRFFVGYSLQNFPWFVDWKGFYWYRELVFFRFWWRSYWIGGNDVG